MNTTTKLLVALAIVLVLDQVFFAGRYLDTGQRMARDAYHHVRW